MKVRRGVFLIGAAAIMTMLMVSVSPAQPQGRITKFYNPDAVVTVRGEVVDVETLPLRSGRGCGVRVTLKAEKGMVAVCLGQSWYIDQHGMEIRPRDGIEVKGSWVTRDGLTYLAAAAVRKGEQWLTLRDEGGIPRWSRRNR